MAPLLPTELKCPVKLLPNINTELSVGWGRVIRDEQLGSGQGACAMSRDQAQLMRRAWKGHLPEVKGPKDPLVPLFLSFPLTAARPQVATRGRVFHAWIGTAGWGPPWT